MKYPASSYAKALAEAVLTAKDKDGALIAKNFLELLRRNGDEGHARKILEEAARFARGRAGIRKVSIASARTLTPEQEHMVAEFTKPGDVTDRSVDPALIAGVRIIVDDETQFDGSLNGKLDRVFGDI